MLNATIRDKGPFKNIWEQPVAGDAGTALGAAVWVDAQDSQMSGKRFAMEHAFWLPAYTDEEIETFLK